MKKFTQFIFYHNAVPIGLGILFLGAGGALAATPAARDAVLAAREEVRSIDNARILNADLGSLMLAIQVEDITEDDDNYYIAYSLATIDVADYVWQDVEKKDVLKVLKRNVEGTDLGIYAAHELGNVRMRETARLADTQRIERKIGQTQKVVATTYSGLIGRFLDEKTETFPGYEPRVQTAAAIAGTPMQTFDANARGASESQNATSSEASAGASEVEPKQLTQEDIERLIEQRVREILAQQQGSGGGSGSSTPPPTETPPPEDTTAPPETTPPDTTPPTETDEPPPAEDSPPAEEPPAAEVAPPAEEISPEPPPAPEPTTEPTPDTPPADTSTP